MSLVMQKRLRKTRDYKVCFSFSSSNICAQQKKIFRRQLVLFGSVVEAGVRLSKKKKNPLKATRR